MPTIVSGSIAILSDAGLGMAMFSLGIYLTHSPSIHCIIVSMWQTSFLISLVVCAINILYEKTGLFMALQPKIIACGKSVATFSMAVRFLTGPAVIAATSIAIGLRGVLLHVAIVQVFSL